MADYKNVSGDVLDIPHLGLRVPDGETFSTDEDLSSNPLVKVQKTKKPAEGETEGAN